MLNFILHEVFILLLTNFTLTLFVVFFTTVIFNFLSRINFFKLFISLECTPFNGVPFFWKLNFFKNISENTDLTLLVYRSSSCGLYFECCFVEALPVHTGVGFDILMAVVLLKDDYDIKVVTCSLIYCVFLSRSTMRSVRSLATGDQSLPQKPTPRRENQPNSESLSCQTSQQTHD